VKRPLYAVYGAFTQVLTIASLVYFAFFVYRVFVPKHIDSGPVGSPVAAFLIDTVLLTIFCGAHSVFARTSVKRWTRRFVPHLFERATYCLLFALMVFGLCFAWRPLPQVVWQITSPAGVAAITVIFVALWLIHFGAIFWMGYAEFFGLRQTWMAARGEEYTPPPPMTRRAFALSHLILVVSLMLLPWATPVMSVGQLYFAVYLTVYDVVGAWLSAKDLSDVPEPVPDVEPQLA
jgi:protein-S-isoprenylcysteine O-methyltransferase Ste14